MAQQATRAAVPNPEVERETWTLRSQASLSVTPVRYRGRHMAGMHGAGKVGTRVNGKREANAGRRNDCGTREKLRRAKTPRVEPARGRGTGASQVQRPIRSASSSREQAVERVKNPEDGTARAEAKRVVGTHLLREARKDGREPRWTCTSRDAEGARNLMGGTTQAAAPVASTATESEELAPKRSF
jgi:hypothetical protein